MNAELVLARGSKSFSFASRFLPRARRADAAVVYAFCRAVDDLADEAENEGEARRALESVTVDLIRPVPQIPFVSAFREVAARRQINLDEAHLLIEGVTSDLGTVRLTRDYDLLTYSRQVAGTVGVMMCGVLGVTDPRALEYAVDLGIAMQLTNICRDVAEDARMGRVYLPQERLAAVGLDPQMILDGSAPRERVAEVVLDLLTLAEHLYERGDRGLRFLPLLPRAAILVASRVYRQIGRKLARAGGDALAGRTVVSLGTKIRLAFSSLFAMPLLPARPA